MNDTIKHIWLGMTLFCIFALIASIPVKKYQDEFKSYIRKKNFAPQAKLDATQKYLEMVERGEINDVYSFGYAPEFLELYDKEMKSQGKTVTTESESVKSEMLHPLFIRDAKNRNILHPYPYK